MKYYYLETSRGGDEWQRRPGIFNSPASANETLWDMEVVPDWSKYRARVIDNDGNVCHHFYGSYEHVVVDIEGDPDWLNDIRSDYGIPATEFKRACLRWLEQNGDDNA